MMSMNGTLDGTQFLSAETVEFAHIPLPWLKDHVVARNVTFSTGGWGLFMSFPGTESTSWTGWGGVGGSLVFWNREKGLSFSYVMNSLSLNGIGDQRGWALIKAFVESFEKTET